MASQNESQDMATLLKPFHERAKLAEDRLEKLEAALEAQKGPARRVDSGILDSLIELKAKLEKSRAEQLAEREKAAKEKEKLQYQIVHLKRSLEEADKKLLQVAPSK
ncbi:unnamed protein product [Calypogeia fissa]